MLFVFFFFFLTFTKRRHEIFARPSGKPKGTLKNSILLFNLSHHVIPKLHDFLPQKEKF